MTDFWTFSCKFYAERNVAEICLTLQDVHDWDVNLALFGLWIASEGFDAEPALLSAAVAYSGRWREDATAPLRELRRRLKPQAEADAAVASFREAVKALELESERLQQQRLETLALNADPRPEKSKYTASEILERARKTLDELARLQNTQSPAAGAQLDTLIAAFAAAASR